ncbi:MAG: hypothetical protein ACKPE6_05400 [Gammaproteobacteria bacterium]
MNESAEGRGQVGRVVVGMGKTGHSLAHRLAREGLDFVAMDSRETPPFAEQFRRELPGHVLHTGGFDARILGAAEEILLSPGIDPREPAIAAAAAQGVPVIGDIEVFWRAARAPIVGITGTNAKSTVTTLVGLMAVAASPASAVGGNLGPPALELLDPAVPLYVLELSSFQLVPH